MPIPVVFLAFSNDIENPLSSLKQESRNLNQGLALLEDRGMIKLFREESATTEDIISTLERIGNPENDYQLKIFHFAGHAGGTGIQLLDQEGNASGLAKLLAQFKEDLSLVFLNGCSSGAQVDLLLQLGIKSVIATSAPIKDKEATLFAESFYRKLASRSTIQQAFRFAANALEFQGKHQPQLITMEQFRDLAGADTSPQDKLPWGLYHDPGSSHVLEWQFVLPEKVALSRPYANEDIQINEYILDVAWEMGKYKQEIQTVLDNPNISDGEQFELIIKHFPWLISTQIRALFSSSPPMNSPTIGRLEQMLSVFVAASQLVYFILLSRIWGQNAIQKIDKINFSLADIFDLTVETFPHFDYLDQAIRLIEEFEAHPDADLFVTELADLKTSMDAKDDFYQAYLFLESKREQLLSGNIQTLEQNILETCLDAEYALTTILCKIAFLVNYQMVTVRDIKLTKIRHEKASFQHYIGKLHAHMESSITVSDTPLQYEYYLDNRSVVLVRDLSHADAFLNLTPFIIDRNAFSEKRDNATNLYAFAYEGTPSGKSGKEYFYLISSQNKLQLKPEQLNEAHLINTGFTPEVDPRNRRRMMRRRTEVELPFAPLKKQFEQLKADWLK